MVRKCSVPGCRTGYEAQQIDQKITVYKFPKDEEKRRRWVASLPNQVKVKLKDVTEYMGVCRLHWPKDTVMERNSGRHYVPVEPPSIFPNVTQSCIPSASCNAPRPTKKSTQQARAHDVDEMQELQERDTLKASTFHDFEGCGVKLKKPPMCCVPGCKSNYSSIEEYITVFKFPTNSELRNKWIQCIPRIDWSPSRGSVVCKKHFRESDIIVSDSLPDKSGVVHMVPRQRPALKPDAYPTIFPNLSGDLSIQVPISCKDPEERKTEIVINHAENNSQWELQDFIKDFEDFKLNFLVNLKSLLETPYKHCVIQSESCTYIMFYTISVETHSAASISVTIKLFPDMSILIFVGNEVINQKHLECVLEKNKVKRWSLLEKLLISYKEASPTNTRHNINDEHQTVEQDMVELKQDACQVLVPDSRGILKNTGKMPRLSVSKTDNNTLTEHSKQAPNVVIVNLNNTSIKPWTGQSTEKPDIEKNGGNLLAASPTQSEEIFSFDEKYSEHNGAGRNGILSCSQTEKKQEEKRKEELNVEVVGSSFTKLRFLNKNPLNSWKKRFMCDMCGDTFGRFINLKSHLRSHFEEKLRKCDICGYTCVLFKDLIEHKNIHVGQQMYRCHLCRASFFYLESLTAHYGEDDVYKAYRCGICGDDFVRLNCLKLHKKTHLDNNTYKCDICGMLLTTLQNLDKHKRRHSIEKTCKCDICGDHFATDGAVLRHKQRKHSFHMCEICGVYISPKCLSDHQLKHTEERPHKCKICGKAFKRPRDLKSHNKIHTAKIDSSQKEFLCHICGAAFLFSHLLKVHNRRHAGVKPYKCGICSASFVDSGDRNRHKRTHNKGRSYWCETCGKSYRRIDYLNAHKKKTHIRKNVGSIGSVVESPTLVLEVPGSKPGGDGFEKSCSVLV